MDCPLCQKELVALAAELSGQRCAECGAVWLDADAAREVFGDFLDDAEWAGEEQACPAGCGALSAGKVSGAGCCAWCAAWAQPPGR